MSDWWTQPSTPAKSSSFHTPARNLAASTNRARFVNDDPDPTAADGPKFLPSFAQSPAGKLALGSSPVSAASPPAPKRSPSTRFSTSLAETASSPRHALSRSSRNAPQQSPMDEDTIPTASLHDDSHSVARSPPTLPALQAGTTPLIMPASLEPSPDTTQLHVFGPPAEHLAALRPYLESIGPVISYEPGPDGSNWWTVTYANPLTASYALRRHGEIVSGRWMLGFKVAGPGSTQGLTLVDGVPPAVAVPGASDGSSLVNSGIGTQMQIRNTNILRPKPKAQVRKEEEFAWEDQDEQPTGILGRAAEFIFGR